MVVSPQATRSLLIQLALCISMVLALVSCGGSPHSVAGPKGPGVSAEPNDPAETDVKAAPTGNGAVPDCTSVTSLPDSAPSGAAAIPAAATTTPEPLKIGTLLPLTGSLAHYGPPSTAGVNLSIKEIKDAGGVLGKPIEVIHRDSGDSKSDIGAQSTRELLKSGVSAVIGAVSSSVSKSVINQITGAGVIQLSPANSSADFSTWDDKGLYWRTAPSDVLTGSAWGDYIAACGAKTLGMIVLNDPYGSVLAENIKAAFEEAGGKVISEEQFNTGDSEFSSQVEKISAARPDAVALISFDQAKSIIPLMADKGISGSQLFMVDGNTSDYSRDFQPGTLKGAQGVLPESIADDDFRNRLLTIDPALTFFGYAGESYDAVNLIALAAESAKSTKSADVASQLKAVSEGGAKCNTYASCVTLLRENKDIDYDGQSGPVAFSDAGDPTEAHIAVYEYQDDNTAKPSKEILARMGARG
ncbi:branched-chain amino acid transport system substrate-binding protein [Pseudarthrobacter sp. W1I19]|uniref:ABC transporter substrate-binding protein n=1 Tax=Pseudarthrobacter sp. W1I19 TaxID=3042288 RepID=UPI0027810E10|nr:ABC transporter substrate-binding protein [Pseudarthrobacter sp. W1I19]MDQ0922340.1 branched-chain amino acid transport system substrate-binding protein [Pseudarthrobacter sp. W1I19]